MFGLSKDEYRQLIFPNDDANFTRSEMRSCRDRLCNQSRPYHDREMQIVPTATMLLFVVRITHKNRLHYFVDAFARLRRTALPFWFWPESAIGTRPYAASLNRQIAVLGAHNAVRRAGLLDERENGAPSRRPRFFSMLRIPRAWTWRSWRR